MPKSGPNSERNTQSTPNHPTQGEGGHTRDVRERQPDGGVSRRKLIIGGGAAGIVGVLLFWNSGSSDEGYDDPEEAVVAFVEHLREGNSEQARDILYEGQPRNPHEVLNGPHLLNSDMANKRTNVVSEDGDTVTVEFLWNDLDHGNPYYDFGALVRLRQTGSGWKIYNFDGSYVG